MLNLNILMIMNMLYQNVPEYTYEVGRIEYKNPTIIASNNNYLTSVTFDDIRFIFDREITNYVIEVPYSKNKVGLNYLQEDPNSIVEVVGDEDLLVGNNSLAILVTAEDGTLREYDFTIIRKEDNTIVQSELDDIKRVLAGSDASKLTVNMSNDSLMLDNKTVETLKDSKKTLVFRWADHNNNFISSLTIDGSKVENTNEINPNVKYSISSTKLINHLKDIEYTPISSKNTNIPEGSMYKLAVDAQKDVYYLYYYDGDILNEKPLRVVDKTVEFEMKDGIDYAITAKKQPKDTSSFGEFHWFWISLFITILFIVFFSITRYTALKVVQHSRRNNKNDSN